MICHRGQEVCKALERLEEAGGQAAAGGGACLQVSADMTPHAAPIIPPHQVQVKALPDGPC